MSPSQTITAGCPTCGAPDTRQDDFCPACGEYLRWEATAEHPVRPATPPAAAPPAVTPPARQAEPERVLLLLDGGAPAPTAAPGGGAAITGMIRNQSDVVDGYELRVDGVPAAWVTLPPALDLLPLGSGDGHEARFEIALSPPRDAAAEARPWPIAVEAVSRSSGRAVARAFATLVVLPFRELRAETRPQRRRSRRGAAFGVTLANDGNAPIDVALSAHDAGGACTTRFDHPALRVAPGERGTARLRVTPRRTIWWGRGEEHTVEVAVDAPDTTVVAPPRAVTLRQRAWIPAWLPVAVLALAALAIALFALRGERIVVPEVRGGTVEAAQQRLVAAGLKSTPRTQEVVVADPAQVGRVLAQDPPPGEEIDADGAVLLRAGVANQVVGVPDVSGTTRDRAQQILQASGLTLGAIEPGDASGEATVDFQNPAAGGQARQGAPVDVILVEPEAAEDQQPAAPPAGAEDPAAEPPAPGAEDPEVAAP